MAVPHAPQSPVECGLKPFVAEGLQQVVGGVCLERPNRVLIVRRHEDDLRQARCPRVSREQIDHGKAVEFRHLHVEKHDVHGRAGFEGRHRQVEGRLTALTATDQFDTVVSRQQPSQPFPARLFVVDYHDPSLVHRRATGR